jgi:hypothetical protein
MNCKQIREAIDTASRHNLYGGNVISHLNDCPDCHRYSDEATSLLGLLGAQPRVEAPPDFDFRLRARMARAQTATASDPRSFLRKIRPETFSRGQMVATAAALALVVTVSTFYIIPPENGAPAPDASVITTRAVAPQSDVAGSASEDKATSGAPVVRTRVRSTDRRVTLKPPSFQRERSTRLVSPNDIAYNDGSTPVYVPETKRRLKYRSRLYGAETALTSRPKPVIAALTF